MRPELQDVEATAGMVPEAGGSGREPRTVPRPGHFYRIQHGQGGLLATAARAYSVPLKPNPLALARTINDHPYNRKFWRSPQNAFERTAFPQGLISFNPRFSRMFSDQVSTPPRQLATRGHSFAAIYIPPRSGLIHPLLGPAVVVPRTFLSAPTAETEAARPNPINRRDYPKLARFATNQPVASPSQRHQPDSRRHVRPSTGIPGRWICSLVAVFYDPWTQQAHLVMGTGVRVSASHVLTAAHVISSIFARWDNQQQRVLSWSVLRARAAIVTFGRDGVRAPFDPLFVLFDSSTSNLRVAPGFVTSMAPPVDDSCLRQCVGGGPRCVACEPSFDRARDFALLRFGRGDRVGATAAFPGDHWGKDPSQAIIDPAVTHPDEYVKLPDEYLSTIGYPYDKPVEQWESSGYGIRRDRASGLHLVDAQSEHGGSGGPVWKETRLRGPGGASGTRLDLTGIVHGNGRIGPRADLLRPGTDLPGLPIMLTLALHDVWPTVRHWIEGDS